MCEVKYKDEINRYCEHGDFSLLSDEAVYQLNGVYRYVAKDYSYFSGGKELPNIFADKEPK